ncbi:hypothetical protein F5Y19DRAFT_492953 [Xylariaceae sp. FL1651]|nr:hypothetical protein F5Y19DRAFT_492953 [Xylariaceae sp. FL1651]
MPPIEQPSREARERAVAIRALLQKPKNGDKVALLVQALIARDVDIHGKMLTNLSRKVQQMQDDQDNLTGECRHQDRLAKRMQAIEEDVQGLEELAKIGQRETSKSEEDQVSLRESLANAVEQHRAQMTEVNKTLESIQKVIKHLQQDTNEIRDRIRKAQSDFTPVPDDISKLKKAEANLVSKVEAMNIKLAQLSTDLDANVSKVDDTDSRLDKYSADVERNKLAIAEIKNQQGTHSDFFARLESNENALLQTFPDHKPPRGVESGCATSHLPRGNPSLAISDFTRIYHHYSERYRTERPESDPKFIKMFLEELNEHASCWFQRHLLDKYPNTVQLVDLDMGQRHPTVFIHLDGLDWKHIKHAAHRTDLRLLQTAVDEAITGPSHDLVMKQSARKRKEPDTELEPDANANAGIPEANNGPLQERRLRPAKNVQTSCSDRISPLGLENKFPANQRLVTKRGPSRVYNLRSRDV